MFDLTVTETNTDGVAWGFEPSGKNPGGVLEVTIPVRIAKLGWALRVMPIPGAPPPPKELLEPYRAWHTLTIRLNIRESLTPQQRQAQLFPPELNPADDWPFNYRVEVIDRVAEAEDAAKKRAAAEKDGKATEPPKFTLPNVTVDIRLFALQGVNITATYHLDKETPKELDPLVQVFGFLTVAVRIDKVSRPESLPDPELPLVNRLLYPAHPVDLARGDTGRRRDPMLELLGLFLVRHRPNRVDIMWTATRSVLSLELTKPGQQGSGFAYWFNPTPELSPPHGSDASARGWPIYDDLLHVHVSGEVTVRLSKPVSPDFDTPRSGYLHPGGRRAITIRDEARLAELFGPEPDPLDADEAVIQTGDIDDLEEAFFVDPWMWQHEFTGAPAQDVIHAPDTKVGTTLPSDRAPRLLRPLADCRFFCLQTHDSVAALPAFGARAPIDEADDDAGDNIMAYLAEPPWKMPLLGQLGADLALAFLSPGISDLADYIELNHALATGKDRWGNEVADWELVLMALSIVPIAGAAPAVLRRVIKAVP